MSTIKALVPRTRTRRIPQAGGFDARRMNVTLDEIARDLQELQDIYTNTLKPLISELPLGANDGDNATDTPITSGLDAIRNGLSGDQVWTDNTATSVSSNLFWDGGRKLTVKETVLKLAGKLEDAIADLNNTFFTLSASDAISAYTIAFIGANAFDATATSSLTSMDGQLDAVQAFVGMDSGTDTTPDYSSVIYISQNSSLETAIGALDAALAAFASASAVYTADGQGIEEAGNQFSIEIDTTGDTVLSKSATGLTALNDVAWWNARKIQGVAVEHPLAPNPGDVLVYNSISSEYESQAPAYTTDHGALGGLGDDDHTQYLLHDGSRAMSGALDMGTNAITNVGLVDGVTVHDHDARHERAGSDEIDGDHLGIDFTPANYTPSIVPAEAAHVDDLAAHLQGIDDAIGTTSSLVKSFTWVGAHMMQPCDVVPTHDKLSNGSLNAASVSLQTIKFVDGDDSYANFPVGIPRNAAGECPATVRVVLSYGGNGGISGTDVVMAVAFGDNGGLDPQVDADPFDFVSWSTPEKDHWTMDTARVHVYAFADETLGTSSIGYLHIQIGRLSTSDTNDVYAGDVHLIGAQVEWTW